MPTSTFCPVFRAVKLLARDIDIRRYSVIAKDKRSVTRLFKCAVTRYGSGVTPDYLAFPVPLALSPDFNQNGFPMKGASQLRAPTKISPPSAARTKPNPPA